MFEAHQDPIRRIFSPCFTCCALQFRNGKSLQPQTVLDITSICALCGKFEVRTTRTNFMDFSPFKPHSSQYMFLLHMNKIKALIDIVA